MEKLNFEKDFKGIFSDLLKQAEIERNEFVNSNQELIQKLKKLKQDYNTHYKFMQDLDIFLLSKFTDLVMNTIDIPLCCENNDTIKDIINGIYENFFTRYIGRNEGWNSYTTVKAKFIINKLIKSLIKNENLSLYATYEGIEKIDKSKWNEQAYWSPKTIKDTDTAFKLFNDWYYFK